MSYKWFLELTTLGARLLGNSRFGWIVLCFILSGICVLASWDLHVNNGAPCLLWTSHWMESSFWRRQLCPLPCILLRELVFCVNIFFFKLFIQHLSSTCYGNEIRKWKRMDVEWKRKENQKFCNIFSLVWGFASYVFNLFFISGY